MKYCCDFGGVNRKGYPCKSPVVNGPCPFHRKKSTDSKPAIPRPVKKSEQLDGQVLPRKKLRKGEEVERPAPEADTTCLLLTPEIQERIVGAVRSGSYLQVAARANGVASRTVKLWVKRGREDEEAGKDTVYSRFYAAVTEARAFAETEAVGVIRKAAVGWDWTRRKIKTKMVPKMAMVPLLDDSGEVVLDENDEPVMEWGPVLDDDGEPVMVEESDIEVTEGTDYDWKAAAFYLERAHPRRWKKTEGVEVSGKDGGPIETTVELKIVKPTSEEKLGR